MELMIDVKDVLFTYWQWLLLASGIATMMQFRVVHNLVMLSLWPARYPLLAVIYVSIFVLYLFAKALDPRAADFIVTYMTKGRTESFPLIRFLKGIYLSISLRRMSMLDFPVFKEQLELGHVINAVNGGKGLGSLESRLNKYLFERNKIENIFMKSLNKIKSRK